MVAVWLLQFQMVAVELLGCSAENSGCYGVTRALLVVDKQV